MKYIKILLLLVVCSCTNTKFSGDLYYIPSPSGDQCLTMVYRTYLFDDENSGVYLYYGKYKQGEEIPNEYLKIKFDDCTDLRIVWTKPLVIQYDSIINDKLDKKKIICYSTSKEFHKDERVKNTISSLDEIFTLDEISYNCIEEKRKMWKERVQKNLNKK